jgi:hypothetical protein
MERSTVFYFLFGIAVVLFSGLADRLLKDRVANSLRITLGLLAAVVTGLILFLIGHLLGVLGS